MSWRNEPGYQSSAEISETESHGGVRSLHVIGDPNGQQGATAEQQGSTTQEFPVPANCRCRLSVWAKSRELAPGAMRLVIEDLATLELPEGSSDWRELGVEFEVGDAPDPTQTIVPLKLSIISAGGGESYLDDLRVTVTRSAPE